MAGRNEDFTDLNNVRGYFTDLITHVRKLEEEYPRLEETCDSLRQEVNKLEEDVEALKRECDTINAQIAKETSSSRDARKMYGDMTVGDTSHQDVILLYRNYFKTAHRKLPQYLEKVDKYLLWNVSSDIVQTCFELNRDYIIEQMISGLTDVLITSPPPSNRAIKDNEADFYRAFEIFVKEEIDDIKFNEIKDGVKEKLGSKSSEQSIDFAACIIEELDPEDYHCFITENKKRQRIYPELINPMATSNKAKGKSGTDKKVCAACHNVLGSHQKEVHMGQHWHHKHLFCGRCRRKFNDFSFKYLSEYDCAYCSHCLCTKCEKPLKDEAFIDTSAKSKTAQYHRKCIESLLKK